MPGKCLINGVIDNLIYQVVQTAHTNISNVHGWTHAHMFHTLEGLNTIRRVPLFVKFFFCFAHISFYLNYKLDVFTKKDASKHPFEYKQIYEIFTPF